MSTSPEPADDDVAGDELGRRLRALRHTRALTLAQLAEETGFSAGYLSEIENGLAIPALSSLADIAAALGTDIAAFFPAEPSDRVRVSRAGGGRRRIRIDDDPTTEYTVLASRGSDGAFSAMNVRMEPGMDQYSAQHFGERFVYVRSGRATLEIAGVPHELRPGSFVHYSSHLAHTMSVTSDDPLDALWLVDPPII